MSEFTDKTIAYQIVSSISGRMRLRIPKLRQDEVYQKQLKKLVESLPNIIDVRISPLAESMIINYSEKLPVKEMEAQIAIAISKSQEIIQPSVSAKESETTTKQTLTKEPQPPITESSGLSTVSETTVNSNTQTLIASPVSLKTLNTANGHQPNSNTRNPTKPAVLPRELTARDVAVALKESEFLTHHQSKIAEPNSDLEENILPINSPPSPANAERIEQLNDQIAEIYAIAAIGSAWLRRWHFHSPTTVNIEYDLTKNENLREQESAIAQLEVYLGDLRLLANIGEARLRKYKLKTYSLG